MTHWKMMCGLAVMCSFAATAGADTTAKAPGMTKTLTGCLQKGSTPGTYTLTNVTGGPEATNKDWTLVEVPATLKLDEHVGHKVDITGVVGGGTVKTEEKATTTGDAGKVETTKEVKLEQKDRHLKVTSMKHVAATCP
jgi:hypothetical protein